MVSFCGICLRGSSPPFIKMTTMIHPMHMQMYTNIVKGGAGALTHMCCMLETDKRFTKGWILESRLCSRTYKQSRCTGGFKVNRNQIYLRLGINSKLQWGDDRCPGNKKKADWQWPQSWQWSPLDSRKESILFKGRTQLSQIPLAPFGSTDNHAGGERGTETQMR